MLLKIAQRNNAMKIMVLVPNRFPRYFSSSSNQTSGEGEINVMNQKLRAMNQKLNALEEKLSNTKSTTTKLTKASIKLDSKQFSAIKKSIGDGFKTIDNDFKLNRIIIQNAITLIDERVSVHVQEKKGERYDEQTLSSLLKDILFSFMNGRGCYIDKYIATYDFPDNGRAYYEDYHEELHEQLQSRLKEEIHELTGTAPVFKLEDGRVTIYHG